MLNLHLTSNSASTFLKETNLPCQNSEGLLDEDLLEETQENEEERETRKLVVGGIFLIPPHIAENSLFADPSFLQRNPTLCSKCQNCLDDIANTQEEECKNCCCCLFACQTRKLFRSRWCNTWCSSSHNQLKHVLMTMWSVRAILSLVLIGSTSMFYAITLDVSRCQFCTYKRYISFNYLVILAFLFPSHDYMFYHSYFLCWWSMTIAMVGTTLMWQRLDCLWLLLQWWKLYS